MENYTKIEGNELITINGGNEWGAAFITGMGGAATGIKFGKALGPWGAVGGAVIGGAVGAWAGYYGS